MSDSEYDWDAVQWDRDCAFPSANGFAWCEDMDGELAIVEYWGNTGQAPPGRVAIPASIGKLPVTCVGPRRGGDGVGVFEDRSAASVHIPEGVKTIGGNAFRRCSGLEFVEIPESVMEIHDNAFGRQDQPYFHLRCRPGSCGERFARAHGIPCLVSKS